MSIIDSYDKLVNLPDNDQHAAIREEYEAAYLAWLAENKEQYGEMDAEEDKRCFYSFIGGAIHIAKRLLAAKSEEYVPDRPGGEE